MNKCFTALKEMVRYCKGDVVILDKALLKMLPYIKNLTWSASVLMGKDRLACPRCASENVVKNGKACTKVGLYQRYRCMKCFHMYRDTHLLKENSND